MVKVQIFQPVEGDAQVGDTVDVDKERAWFLVRKGKALYVNKGDAEFERQQGGAPAEGQVPGVKVRGSAKPERGPLGTDTGIESNPSKVAAADPKVVLKSDVKE